jgi:hypothetical protein
MVLLPGDMPVGCMVPVHVTGALEYDLIGEVEGDLEEAGCGTPGTG